MEFACTHRSDRHEGLLDRTEGVARRLAGVRSDASAAPSRCTETAPPRVAIGGSSASTAIAPASFTARRADGPLDRTSTMSRSRCVEGAAKVALEAAQFEG